MDDFIAHVVCLLFLATLVFGGVGGCMYAKPKYEVYSQRMLGEAEFARAESNRRIIIEEARAEAEAMEHREQSAIIRASYQKQAEITRAEGVAEANTIIGNSLRENEAYLRWLWIETLKDDSNTVIYVPTEANLPILEAGKR